MQTQGRDQTEERMENKQACLKGAHQREPLSAPEATTPSSLTAMLLMMPACCWIMLWQNSPSGSLYFLMLSALPPRNAYCTPHPVGNNVCICVQNTSNELCVGVVWVLDVYCTGTPHREVGCVATFSGTYSCLFLIKSLRFKAPAPRIQLGTPVASVIKCL